MATVADHVIAELKRSGVHRVYGLPGDSLNDFTDAIRRAGDFAWELVRHEETAAFAAAADAALPGRLAVCSGSCGPGNLHLVNGLFDAQRSRVPVLAIAAHIPRAEIGSELLSGNPPTRVVPRMQRLLRACQHSGDGSADPAHGDASGDRGERRRRGRRPRRGVRPPDARHRLGVAAGSPAPSVCRPDELSLRGGGSNPQRSRTTSLSWPGRALPGAHDQVIRLAATLATRRSCTRCAARSLSSTTTLTTSG